MRLIIKPPLILREADRLFQHCLVTKIPAKQANTNFNFISCNGCVVKFAERFLCSGRKTMSGPGNTGLFQPIRMKYCIEEEGGMDQWWSNKQIFWVIFHPGKAQKAQESCICPKVRGLQNSDLNAVGWNNICHQAWFLFVNLWGACDSSVLQCTCTCLLLLHCKTAEVHVLLNFKPTESGLMTNVITSTSF
jgi:hypothetical protein